MITRYRYEKPFLSESVVLDLPIEEKEIPYFDVQMEDTITFTYQMGSEDIVYGLGENIHGINKRGFTYESRCMDGARHTDDRISLYAAHNFLLIEGVNTFGVFFDTASIVRFDVGDYEINTLQITVKTKEVDVYIIEGNDMASIVQEFRKLIGRSYIPPKWAFGYQQSRWGYRCEDDFRKVAQEYKKHQIPLDALYLDIDYMEDYESFTIDREHFPHFETLVEEMKEDGIHLVPIIDAGIKVKKGYHVYEEGVEKNYFCKDKDGNNFQCGVWPGFCHFADVLNSEARAWFGDQYKVLMDKGIDGFWNDMNEPSIFYTEERLNEAYALVDELRGGELDLHTYFKLRSKFAKLTSNPEDYKLFYHNVDGQMIRHDKVHNMFGYFMTRAAKEAFDRIEPEKRILLFSRSSCIGMHRYSGIWTGDNHSWWSHLKMNIQMMPSLNMCGFLYSGADLGGFSGDTTEELMMRWLEFGLFAPLMRNHNQGMRDQELYTFTNTENFKHIIEIRYALLPYLYSEFMKAAQNDTCYFRTLHFDYPQDERTKGIEDQLMVGEAIMVTPIYEQNARGRYVYLPEDMMMVRMRTYEDFDTVLMEKGDHYIQIGLADVIFFIRKDHIVPMAKPAMNTARMNFNELSILGYVEHAITYTLYDDDGYTKDYQNPTHLHEIHADKEQVSCATKHVYYM